MLHLLFLLRHVDSVTHVTENGVLTKMLSRGQTCGDANKLCVSQKIHSVTLYVTAINTDWYINSTDLLILYACFMVVLVKCIAKPIPVNL